MELLVRSKGYFQFMEPVNLELRLRNTTDLPFELETQLNPEYGGVTLYIRQPNGRILEYAPIFCKLATPEIKTLKPKNTAKTGEDRHSQNVFASYGTYGYYFDTPGEYLIRVVYNGPGDLFVNSPVHRLRIGQPFSRDEERTAQDYFTYESGMALYLKGSSSPFLQKGMDTLQEMAERFQESPVGAYLAMMLGVNLSRPFFRIKKGKLVESRSADLAKANALTSLALKQQEQDETTFTNVAYHEFARERAESLAAMGAKAEAKKELRSLAKYLKGRGVNESVLKEIDTYTKNL